MVDHTCSQSEQREVHRGIKTHAQKAVTKLEGLPTIGTKQVIDILLADGNHGRIKQKPKDIMKWLKEVKSVDAVYMTVRIGCYIPYNNFHVKACLRG